MGNKIFREMIEGHWADERFVCVGLDPELGKIPKHLRGLSVEDTLFRFCTQIIDATHDLVSSYKPNAAFFESHGEAGTRALKRIVSHINRVAPGVPVIYDAKRADIGNTNLGYLESAFTHYGADAITVHPYLGKEALKPLLDRGDKGIIVLCRTSNPGAGELQDLSVVVTDKSEIAELSYAGHMSYPRDGAVGVVPLYKYVAYCVSRYWNTRGNCMLVVGATYPDELAEVRNISPDMGFLIPGIGAQGGDLAKTVRAGQDYRRRGMIINSSRGIIYASGGKDFADAARLETLRLHVEINRFNNS